MKAIKKQFTLLARPAKVGEKIETTVNGVKETQNTAKVNDYVITGIKGEQYIISKDVLVKRYDIETIDHPRNEYDYVNITTKPVVIDCSICEEDMTFTASWGEDMVANTGDFLVYEDGKLSYRIEREVFLNTYELETK